MKNERNKTDQTKLLYETDGMMTEFDATVTGSGKRPDGDGYYAMLDRTAFFPEGGGQNADTGVLIKNGETFTVSDVQTVDGCVYHYVDKPLDPGDTVHGKIDAAQRFSRMQDHGAEHLVSGLIHNMYGYDNVGFHSSDDGLVIDVNGPMDDDMIKAVETRANEIVFENVPVTISFPSSDEARNMEYRSKLDVYDNIRLVTIEGVDVCACCAPHVDSTGRFGVIKIIDHMPHRGGTRLMMVAGMNAYRDYSMLHDNGSRIMALLSAKRNRIADHTQDLTERFAAQKEENTALRKELTRIVTEGVLDRLNRRSPDETGPEVIFTKLPDPVGLRELVNRCTKVYTGIVCAFTGSDEDGYRYIFGVCEKNAKDAGLKQLSAEFNKYCSGKGGGSDVMVQGTSTAGRDLITGYFSEKVKKR